MNQAVQAETGAVDDAVDTDAAIRAAFVPLTAEQAAEEQAKADSFAASFGSKRDDGPHRIALEALTLGLARWSHKLLPDPRSPISNALAMSGEALSYPYRDTEADERQCEAALRALTAIFVRVFSETDQLLGAEVEAIWYATAYIDGLDEAAREAAEAQARNAYARACLNEAQRLRSRGRRNRQRQRREAISAGLSAEVTA